jgi:hypothetical protein
MVAWAISGEHLSPIGSLMYLYLLNGVTMVHRSYPLLHGISASGGGIGGGGDVYAPYFSYWCIAAGSYFGQKEQMKFNVYETRLAPPLTQHWKER